MYYRAHQKYIFYIYDHNQMLYFNICYLTFNQISVYIDDFKTSSNLFYLIQLVNVKIELVWFFKIHMVLHE